MIEIKMLHSSTDMFHIETPHFYPADEIKMYPVSKLMNSPKNDLPEVIKLSQQF
jgi:hypothetical protein